MTAEPFAKADRALLRRRDLTASVKIVYAVVLDEMRGKGRVSIGIRKLATETGLHRNSVPSVIRAIEESGLLLVEHPGNGRRTRFTVPTQSATQTVALSKIPGATQTVAERHTNRGASASQTVTRPDSDLVPDVGARPTAPRKRTKMRTPKSRSAHHEVIRHFIEGWSKRHNGAKYTFANGRDGKAVKTVLAAVDGDVARATRIVDLYLGDDDAYIGRAQHPLALIQTRLNTYAAQVALATTTTASAVPDHWIVQMASERFGPEVADAYHADLETIAGHVESGKLPERRVRSAMRSAGGVAAFMAQFTTEEGVADAG